MNGVYLASIDGRLMKRILSEEIEGTRPQRRPHRKSMDIIRETMMKFKLSREVDWNITKNIKK